MLLKIFDLGRIVIKVFLDNKKEFRFKVIEFKVI